MLGQAYRSLLATVARLTGRFPAPQPTAETGDPPEPAASVVPFREPLGPVVYALVNNHCTNDTRVLKQAYALARSGYHVVVHARTGADCLEAELVDGVEFRRFDCFAPIRPAEDILEAAIRVFGSRADEMRRRLTTVLEAAEAKQALQGEFEAARAEAASAKGPGAAEIRARYHGVREALRAASEADKAARIENVPYLRYLFYASNLLARDLSPPPDIVHAHDLFTLPAAAALAERYGCRVVYDAHEIETERMPPLAPDMKAFIDDIERRLLRRTDEMVVVCESAAEFYAERFGGKRPYVVMNTPERLDGPASVPDVRTQAGIAPGTPIMVYTGNVGREGRGLQVVIQALARLPDMHLVVLGPRHDRNDAWLMELAVEAGVEGRVHLLPPVGPNEVVAAIAGADVGVCLIQDVTLSYRYALPNKLFEMAFAGVPICASDLPEMGRFVRELGVGVAVDQSDVAAIVEAIRTIRSERDRYALSSEAAQILEDRYSWATQATTLNRLYYKLRPQPTEAAIAV